MENQTTLLFWNVDTQYDFMNPDGALYVPGAETILPNLKSLQEIATKLDIPIVHTKDWHDEKNR